MARRVHQRASMTANAVKSAPEVSPSVGDLLCPNCRSKKVLPSHHLSWYDYALGVIGVRPFRCHSCYQRFRRWLVWTWRCGG